MMIHRTVLCGVVGLLLASSAHAQHYHSGGIHLRYHHPHHLLHTTHHLHYPHRVHVSSHVQTAMLPPAPSSVTFGAFSHVDDLAARLEVLMNQLCLDLYYNYSHNPGFHETYAEAYSLFQTVRSIHAAEHNLDREAVRSQLGGADALFHHIEDDVRGWSRIPRRQIGTLGILTKMEMAEETLHHLMEDVGVTVAPGLEEPPVPSSLSTPPSPLALP